MASDLLLYLIFYLILTMLEQLLLYLLIHQLKAFCVYKLIQNCKTENSPCLTIFYMLKYKICCAVSISGRERMSHSFYCIATKCACSNNCMTQMTQICDSIELFYLMGWKFYTHARSTIFASSGFGPLGPKPCGGNH